MKATPKQQLHFSAGESMKLEWKREEDGSYTSVAGRIWRYPGETWKDCCITPVPELTGLGHRGRAGNLRESKELLEREWAFQQGQAKLAALQSIINPRVLADAISWFPLTLKLTIPNVSPKIAVSIFELLKRAEGIE
jgi:hypothetical protein